jgi:hypothetical protein
MARKFMYVCFGILALVVAFHMGARYGNASIVDHSATGVIASTGQTMLLDTGEVWRWESDVYGWQHHSYLDPPIPVSQIKFWTSGILLSTSDDLWVYDQPSHPSEWHNYGRPGTGGVSTQSTTWGEIKAEFGE